MMDSKGTLARLIDEAAIRDAVARFADTCIRGDHDGFRSLWAPDGVWTIAQPFQAACHGIEEIAALLHQLRDGRDFFVQFVSQGVIELAGDAAHARWVCREVARGPGETFYDNFAIYYDRMRRDGDHWVFVKRDYRYLWLSTGPIPVDPSPSM